MPIFYDVYITSKYSFLCPLPFMWFKQCFMKVFMIFFLVLKFDISFSPLNTWKQQDLGFACIHRGKMSNFKSRKKSPFRPISIYRSYHFGKRHDMIQCTTFQNFFLKNACNLGHSIIHLLNIIFQEADNHSESN